MPAHAGSVQLGTYYPAPFGSYDRLRLVPRATLSGACDPGSIYVEDTGTTLQFCAGDSTWEPLPLGYWLKVGSDLYPADDTANVGLGTETPSARLHLIKSSTSSAKDLNIADTAAGHTGAFAVLKGTNRSWAVGTTNAASSAGDGKLGFVDKTAGDIYRMVIDNTGKVGMGTTNPEFRLTLDKGASAPDGGILAIGTYNPNNAALTDLATAGAGTRLIWYPKKAVFRAGYVSGTKWDEPTNIGNYSVAMGQDPRADADHSIALGYGTNTTGANSFATGKSATASGADSIAMGNATVASGTRSVAMGDTTTASGMNSTATGNNTTAIGNFSTAMDNYTTARAYASLVIGQYNIVTGTETTNNWIDTDPLFIIGNGNGIVGDPNQYANALTVLKNGNVGIGTTNPGTNRLEVTGGNIKSGGGLIMETTTNTTVTTPVAGLVWLCTDIGNGTPCDGI